TQVTAGYFQSMALLQTGQLAADMKAVIKNPPDKAAVARLSELPYENALLRSTCVATRLEGGHADNALPQTARAVVNCRLLPGDSPVEVRSTLIRVLDDPKISITPMGDAITSSRSPMRAEVLDSIEQLTSHMW